MKTKTKVEMISLKSAPRKPNGVDLYCANAIRTRRKMQGVSLEELGAALKLSQQQMQKYETGANRITLGRLYQVARALDCSPFDLCPDFSIVK